jgi:hypothetical protein
MEFRSGPLYNFAWMHNQLALNSYAVALEKLQKMSRGPKRHLTSTSIQALQNAAGSISHLTVGDLEKKYGKEANPVQVLADEFRLVIKTKIFRAWSKRRSLTTDVIVELGCFAEREPLEEGKIVKLTPLKCTLLKTCSMVPHLIARPGDLDAMKTAVDASPPKEENKTRSEVLRHLTRTPKRPFDWNMCRRLGDAVFAFLAPPGSVILTTNVVDHKPLAQSLGKSVQSP